MPVFELPAGEELGEDSEGNPAEEDVAAAHGHPVAYQLGRSSHWYAGLANDTELSNRLLYHVTGLSVFWLHASEPRHSPAAADAQLFARAAAAGPQPMSQSAAQPRHTPIPHPNRVGQQAAAASHPQGNYIMPGLAAPELYDPAAAAAAAGGSSAAEYAAAAAAAGAREHALAYKQYRSRKQPRRGGRHGSKQQGSAKQPPSGTAAAGGKKQHSRGVSKRRGRSGQPEAQQHASQPVAAAPPYGYDSSSGELLFWLHAEVELDLAPALAAVMRGIYTEDSPLDR
jgi:hypothetical protein